MYIGNPVSLSHTIMKLKSDFVYTISYAVWYVFILSLFISILMIPLPTPRKRAPFYFILICTNFFYLMGVLTS